MAKKRNGKTKAPVKVETSRKQDDGRVKNTHFVQYCFVLLLAGVLVLAWMSLLTFSPADSESMGHPPQPAKNSAGRVGAYIADRMWYWLGGGAYVGLFFATIAAGVMLCRRRIGELPLRIIGVVVLTTASSAAMHLMNPDVPPGDMSQWSAGILGTYVGDRLLFSLALPGGWTILVIAFILGLILSADRVLLLIYHLAKKALPHRERISAIGGILRRPENVAPAAQDSLSVRTRPAPVVAVAPPKPVPAPPKPIAVKKPEPPKVAPKPASKPAVVRRAPRENEYKLPSTELLAESRGGYIESQEGPALHKRAILQQTLNDFNVEAQVVGHMTGPVITMYELSLAPGVKVAQVSRLSNDISRALAVPGVRVVSPLPGRDTIGIEVPNMEKEIVRIRELMDLEPGADKSMFIPLYLGKDAEGNAIVTDLAKMPHMLIAGTTGSGKSVCINSIIMAILMKRRPEDIRLILVDPKMVEMAAFDHIPHLLCPIVNDMHHAESILDWAATKMDERYELLKEAGVKNIVSFNRLSKEEIYERFHAESEEDRARIPTHIPYYVIIVDELADLIMTSSKEVESHIIRIAQKARAVGIHLILATQRPSVNVVTGLIKSNMPCRVSFRVASRQESRIVLDQNGADVLLGQGDMLVLLPGTSNLLRAQGTFVDDSEIRSVVKALRSESEPQFNRELMKINSRSIGDGGGEKDELFDKAVEIVLSSKRGSVSLLQRRLSIGYSRSSRIIDQMADSGLLGDYKGSQARECLMTLEDWQEFKKSVTADQSGASSEDGTPTSS